MVLRGASRMYRSAPMRTKTPQIDPWRAMRVWVMPSASRSSATPGPSSAAPPSPARHPLGTRSLGGGIRAAAYRRNPPPPPAGFARRAPGHVRQPRPPPRRAGLRAEGLAHRWSLGRDGLARRGQVQGGVDPLLRFHPWLQTGPPQDVEKTGEHRRCAGESPERASRPEVRHHPPQQAGVMRARP